MSDAPPLVALTFDAEHPDRALCPPDSPARILDTLAEAGVRATFFIQGRWASAYPALTRRIAVEGHRIGNHSHFHARMTMLSDAGLREDVREAEDRIRRTTGTDPRPWFRCPFGEGHEDPRVVAALGDLGYRDVHWDVLVADWEEWQTAEGVRQRVVQGVARNGPIVLLHTWPGPTADALPRILTELRERDARFLTLDELEATSGMKP